MEKAETAVGNMMEMLKYRRPHRSKTERKFITKFIGSLGVTHDRFGNRYKKIGDAPIMYSCHTDSVHRAGGLQDIAIKGTSFKLHRTALSNCLGADNAAGVWMMTQMIKAEKPGLYVFHRGEEVGCEGSKYIVKNTPELVKDIKAGIAFDRRGTKSIITHQWGGRCCSNDFAESLANELKLGHEKDSGGTVTDTAQYTDLIPECTNVSVGFNSEHSNEESLDMAYLMELRQSMMEYNWENLVIKRSPGEYEAKTYSYTNYYDQSDLNYHRYNGRRFRWEKTGGYWEEWDESKKEWLQEKLPEKAQYAYDAEKKELVITKSPIGFLEYKKNLEKKKTALVPFTPPKDFLPDGHELEDRPAHWLSEHDNNFIIRMVRSNPLLIAKLLGDYGISVDDLADFLHAHNGIVPRELYGSSYTTD